VVPTFRLGVLYGSQNKQQLLPCALLLRQETPITDCIGRCVGSSADLEILGENKTSRQGGSAPVILNIDTIEVSGQLHAAAVLIPRKETPISVCIEV
jgi:hypothetical protein